MEKEIGSKEVKMGVVKNFEAKPQSTVQPEKLSYEKLNEVCMNLSQQNQQMDVYIQKLHKQMGEMADIIKNKRIDYLFKVVELHVKRPLFSEDFIGDCVAEIQQVLTPPTEGDDKEETKED